MVSVAGLQLQGGMAWLEGGPGWRKATRVVGPEAEREGRNRREKYSCLRRTLSDPFLQSDPTSQHKVKYSTP